MAIELPIQVLLFDDNLDYCKTLKLRANKENIQVAYRHSWDNALEELSENHLKYQFVILDARSFLREDQAAGSESINSAIKAMSDIKELQGKVNHPIPFCMNTGYSEYRQMFEAVTLVFEKGEDSIALLKHIKDVVDKLPETKIRNHYFEAFQVFEYGYLERGLEQELINIIKRIGGIHSSTEKSVLRDMRPFVEAIFSNLNSQIPGFFPNRVIRGNNVELGGAITFMAGSPRYDRDSNTLVFEGNQYMPLHVYYLAKAFKDATSDIGMHYGEDTISRYLVLAQFNAMLEITLWYRAFMNKYL